VWEDITDILLELEDNGFLITKHIDEIKQIENKVCEDVIEVIIDKFMKNFSFSQIEEEVRRLIDYMLAKGWNYSLMCIIGNSYHSFECGGSHELAGVEKSFRSGSERDLHKSLVRRKVEDATAIKVVFYSNISRLINN
jgi:hypothetical protein